MGYSYIWNDEQTDAELVERNGQDATFEIRDPAGARRLMDDHVKMIRSRRVSEHKSKLKGVSCC